MDIFPKEQVAEFERRARGVRQLLERHRSSGRAPAGTIHQFEDQLDHLSFLAAVARPVKAPRSVPCGKVDWAVLVDAMSGANQLRIVVQQTILRLAPLEPAERAAEAVLRVRELEGDELGANDGSYLALALLERWNDWPGHVRQQLEMCAAEWWHERRHEREWAAQSFAAEQEWNRFRHFADAGVREIAGQMWEKVDAQQQAAELERAKAAGERERQEAGRRGGLRSAEARRAKAEKLDRDLEARVLDQKRKLGPGPHNKYWRCVRRVAMQTGQTENRVYTGTKHLTKDW